MTDPKAPSLMDDLEWLYRTPDPHFDWPKGWLPSSAYQRLRAALSELEQLRIFSAAATARGGELLAEHEALKAEVESWKHNAELCAANGSEACDRMLVAQEERDKLKAENEALKERVEELKTDVQGLNFHADGVESQLTAAQAALDAERARVGEAQAKIHELKSDLRDSLQVNAAHDAQVLEQAWERYMILDSGENSHKSHPTWAKVKAAILDAPATGEEKL